MPAEAPTINSKRVLRAYRLNAVENVLLRHRILTMGKEKRRMVRINNQDIRLIQLTLDYIQSSSGHSPEGRPPNYVAPDVQRDDSPYFLYGDRIKSRKYGKQRRAQSAHVSFGRYDTNGDEDASEQGSITEHETQEENLPKSRPKSSPAVRQRRYGEVTRGKVGGYRPAETGVFVPGAEASLNGTHVTVEKPASHDKTREKQRVNSNRPGSATSDVSLNSEVIPELDKESEAGTSASRPSPLSLTRFNSRPTSETKKPKAFVTEPTPSPDPSMRLQTPEKHLKDTEETNEESTIIHLARPGSRKKAQGKSNGSDLTARVNQERAKMQSARKKPDPMQAWGPAAGSPKKIEEAMVFKGRLNESRNKVLQDKLDAFKLQYPTKRY